MKGSAGTWQAVLVAVCVALPGAGCDDDEDEEPIVGEDGGPTDAGGDDGGGLAELDLAVCAPESGGFTVEIDNRYLPFPVGLSIVLEGEDAGTALRVELTVLDETEEVAGVTTRVVEERELEDEELVEVSRNFFVQAADGTVCYYGEDVDDYEGGAIVGHEGAWRAGVGANEPGILMPGDPQAQTMFSQEVAPGVAEDRSAIVAVGVPASVGTFDFADTLEARDWNPLEGGTFEEGETKRYAAGIGLVVDDVLEVVEYTVP